MPRAAKDGPVVAQRAPTVLVIDDVGLLPMARDAASSFFHVINSRYERGSPTVVTTNRS
jgi:DNA replication protein DnaC